MARPTKYKPEFCAKVLECGAEGMSKAEMADAIGIAYSTFDLWERQNPEFSDAVKDARRKSQAWWERKGRICTFDSEGFNATSYIFQMKNRFREDWNDTHKVVGAGQDGEHIHKVAPHEAFQRLARRLEGAQTGAEASPDLEE